MTSPSFSVFLLTVLVATVIPGPSMLLALEHGIRFGVRRATATALGNVCATAVQCGISFAGLGLLLVKLGWAFTAVRYLGAAYLIYLGLSLVFGGSGAEAGRRREYRGGLFAEAFLVTMGNPKAIFFFTALFPQFIAGDTLTVPRAAGMMAAVLAITFASMLLYAAAGQRLEAATASRRLRQWINRTVGAAFVGLGAALAFERR